MAGIWLLPIKIQACSYFWRSPATNLFLYLCRRLPSRHPVQHRHHECSGYLSNADGDHDQSQQPPSAAAVHLRHIRLQPTRSEVEREKKTTDEVLYPLYQFSGEVAVLGYGEAEDERAEDGVDADQVGGEAGGQDAGEGDADVGLAVG